MKFLEWYLKIAIGAALVGGSMELFMIKTGFCVRTLLSASSLTTVCSKKKKEKNSLYFQIPLLFISVLFPWFLNLVIPLKWFALSIHW